MDNSTFTPVDGLGLLAGFGYKAPAQQKPVEFGPDAPTPQQRENADAAEFARTGNETDAGRYEVVPEGEVSKWQEDWKAKEASTGLAGDAKRLAQIGGNSMLLGIREAVRQIPKAGPMIVNGLDAVDMWMTGKTSETILKDNVKFHEARLTPETQAARKKEFVTETKNGDGSISYGLGPAWSDPRSYFSGAVESIPGTVASMAPGAVLARGAFLRAMASGAGREAAAASAARTALVAGAVSEGIIGGGSTAHEVRDQIASLPEDTLKQSSAYQALIEAGKSPREAREALANDSATKAFVLSGVANGIFGGQGDRVLAKLVAEGVSGGLGKRLLKGAGQNAIAEGLLEELPQSVGEKLAENYVMRNADPKRRLSEGVANAGVSGAIAGGVMGAGFGAAGAVRAPGESAPIAAAEPVQPETKKGPLARAVEYGAAQESARAPSPALTPAGLPGTGENVSVTMEGGASFPARIEGYKDGEALVSDPSSGELLQVPLASISQLPPEQFGKEIVKAADAAAATPPAQAEPPMEVRSELPPARETVTATEIPAGLPVAGQRAIVDAGGGERFPAALQGFVTDQATGKEEALVRRDDGSEAQVPVEALKVSNLAASQVEKQELAKNPPIPREKPTGSRVRSFSNRFVEMPDDLHARLYDLGRARTDQIRMLGKSKLDMDNASAGEQEALATAFGVGAHELGQIADDYRYRVERAARGAKSDLPVQMHKVNDKLLERKRSESARTAEKAGQADEVRSALPVDMKSATDEMAHVAATSPLNDTPQPTEAQKEAGNYKKGHVSLGGLDITIENPAGSKRSGTDKGGKSWSVEMKSHYGYIKGTVGKDKDHIDVFIKPGTEGADDASRVYVIDQVAHDGAQRFDEHKVMVGFDSEAAAKKAYAENYTKGWKGLGSITETTLGDFKQWLATGDTAKPYAPAPEAGSRDKLPAPEGPAGKAQSTDEGNQQRKATIDNARKLGLKLLDTVDRSVEAMRGLTIFNVHDANEFGVVRTVSNNGDVVVDWSDAYSAKKNLADPGDGAKFGRSWLAPSDLKDYAVDRNPSPEKAEKKDEPVKWFGARDRAETYMTKKKLGTTHEIVEAGRSRFEVRPKAEIAENAKKPTRAEIAPVEPTQITALPEAPAKPSQAVSDTKAEFSGNKLFTADKVAAARARLRSKMTQINSGIDPEVLIDGMTIAGAYIESGVRSFAEYAKRMADDFGENIKPYLLSFWEGARNYPGLDTKGMTSPEQSKTEFDALMNSADKAEVAHVIGEKAEKPKARKRKTGAATDMVLTQDWGVDHIDGYGDADRETGNSTKDAFLKEARSYLKSASDLLAGKGYEPHLDRKGNPDKPVSVNEGGVATSGEVSLTMMHPDGGGIYVKIGEATLRGMVPTTQSGVAIMFRRASQSDKYGVKGINRWAPVDLSVADFVEMLDEEGKRGAADEARRRDNSAEAAPAGASAPEGVKSGNDMPLGGAEVGNDTEPNAGSPARRAEGQGTGSVPANDTGSDLGRVSEPARGAGDGMAGRGEGETRGRGEKSEEPALRSDAPAAASEPELGDQDARGDRATGSDSGNRSARGEPPAAEEGNSAGGIVSNDGRPVSAVGENHRIAPGDLKREGSWRVTAERNVSIVELVNQLEKEGRRPTSEEAALLTRFTGWGASEIANNVFETPKMVQPGGHGVPRWETAGFKPGWEAIGQRLKAALSPEEYAQAKRTTQYAHYTGEDVIRPIYSALERMGFAGGRVLEPGMGIGLFNGLMPASMAANSRYTGVEYDTLTGRIAKLLYPQSDVIIGDYAATPLPKDYFDLAIGNPPFSSTIVSNDPEYKKFGFMLHDYFFAKTIDRVKPGGLLVFVTSKGTMDKVNDRARRYLAARADLVGAIRLPQTAFKENAGTDVVTDILFLQKRAPGAESNGIAWKGTAEISTPQGPTQINEYFAAHPEMVLGNHELVGSMYRANEYTVTPKPGTSIEAELSKALKNLPEAVYKPSATNPVAAKAASVERDYNPAIRKEGGLYVSEKGDLMQVESGSGIALTERLGSSDKPIPLKEKEIAFLKDWVGLRDALKVAYKDQLNDGEWQASLKALRSAYDGFVAKHGPLRAYSVIERDDGEGNISTTKRFKNDPLLRLDVEGVLAHALEKIDEATGEISPDKVLSERVLAKPRDPEIHTVQDALFVSLNAKGRLDLDHVASLASMTREEAIATLGAEIYEAPNGEWETSDKYLSGDVRAKLRDAEAAAKLDARFKRNVEALLAVQPRPLGPSEITIGLGQNWIASRHIDAFAKEAMGENLRTRYSEKTGSWEVLSSGRGFGEFNTSKMSADEILSAVLNNRQIKVTQRDVDGKTHVDTVGTESANSVATKMREAFRTWVWTDKARADELVSFYNTNFNNIAPRKFDGSHLTLPGTSLRFNLYPHQKRAIWRAVQVGDTYLAHAVGAGKTMTMIATGMEERRLGLSKKPMFAVPNHMLAQFAREFLELYPAANLMVADEANFHTSNRKRFVAQAALNDPDAIIITHSAFGRIAMSEDYSRRFIEGQIEEWKEALDETDKSDRFTRKQIERRIEQLERRLDAKMGDKSKKDAALTFEEIGVDRIFLDEAHEFRKLDFATNQGSIKGIDPSGSQRAMDLFMKVSYLRSKKPERALLMASGTPVTNTMGELFTVQRFFQQAQLEADGHAYFDAWANHYGSVVAGFEQNAAGGYEIVSRFAKFQNVPELMRRVRSFMDILTSSDLGSLVQRPSVKTGGRQVIITEVPDGYRDYQRLLTERIASIRRRKGPPKPGDDIILSVIADGRFSAIDMRFVDPNAPSDPESKLNRAIDAMVEAYRATAGREYVTDGKPDQIKGGTLLLFSDIGLGEQSAKSRGFDMRDWIEKRLMAAGIPSEHVAFIRDYKAHAKKERLFADMREGKKRILIGGKDMETGVNVQKRLAWLGHLDAPWFPASVEQREGRIIRQGNQNPEVEIMAFATKGSYDSTMWGMNARKARFIEQALNGDETVRSIEDVSEASAFEVAAALASGDERYLKLAGLKADVERLERLAQAHHDEQRKLQTSRYVLSESTEADRKDIAALESAIAKRKPIKPGEFEGKIGGTVHTSREAFSEAIFKRFADLAGKSHTAPEKIGEVGGFPLMFRGEELIGKYRAAVSVGIPGKNDPIIAYPFDADVAVGGIATRAANQINGMDRRLMGLQESVALNEKRIAQIDQRIGAPFAEQAALIEKHSEYVALQAELASETSAAQAAEAAEAAAATVEVAKNPAIEEGSKKYSQKPVAELTGEELGVEFKSGEDMPALRKAAQDWYRENLLGTTAMTRDGMAVQFKNSGLKKSTFGAKGDLLLRSVPAIRSIIENGEVALSEPGNRQGVDERVVLRAPVKFAGSVRSLAVTIQKAKDGNWQYDLHHDREAEGLGLIASGDASSGPAAKQSRQSALESTLGDINIFEIADPGKKRDGMSLRAELATHHLGSVARGLIEAGKVRIVEQAPADAPVGVQGWTESNGTITLVAGAIPEGRAMAVLLHEAFHAGARPLLGEAAWAKLMDNVAPIYRQFERGAGPARTFFDAARASVKSAGALGALAIEEFAAYSVENAENAPRALRIWVDQIVGHVKAWMLRRFGVQAGAVTPGQLRSIAVAAMREAETRAMPAAMAEGGGPKYSLLPSPSEAAAQIKGKLTDLTPAMLAAIPLNYFSELKRPAMSAIDTYLGLKRAMDAYRGSKHEKADQIAQEWLNYTRLGIGKDGKAKSTELADLMHDSTLAGVDPSMAPDAFEDAPPEAYHALRRRFAALPAKGQALFEAVRDAYKAQSEEMDTIIVANVRRAMEIAAEEAQRGYLKEVERIEKSKSLSEIEKSDALNEAKKQRAQAVQRSHWANKARITRLREAFESSRLTGPYFPLARFGRYFVALKDVDGEVLSFQKFEHAAEMNAAASEMRALAAKSHPGASVEQGVLDDTGAARQAMDPRIVAEIETILGGASVDPAVMDTIWQRYLETMPEMSIRKRQIHRKGTAGFQKDALRVFANHMFHASHQMARMKFGLELQEAVNKAADQARLSDDPVRGSTLVNELRKRHEWVMNPTGGAFAQKVTSAMFVWYLAASPASALVNLTQTVIVGLPVLGAKLGGISKAAPELMRAAGDFIAGKGDARKAGLSADETRAMSAFYETGLIDRTRSHDLAGVGNTGAEYSPLRARVMEKVSWMFHQAEVFNREVTALAAYRLARKAGEDHQSAVNTAHDLTWKTHFDYSNSNRPRIMQGDVAKVALVFQNFQINMWYRFFRDLHQSMKGETAQARREARYQIAGITGMLALLGGVTSVFGFKAIMMLAGLFFDDKDDPREFEEEFKASIVKMFGADLGAVILKGAPGTLLNVDIASRIGMADFLVRTRDSNKEGRDAGLEWIAALMGASVSTVLNTFDGVKLIMDGNAVRGLEVMAPKAIKDLMQSYRFADEGLESRKGNTILERDKLSNWDIASKAIGFTSARVSETYDRNRTLNSMEKKVQDERKHLVEAWATARMHDDDEARAKAMERIKEFNARPYARGTIRISQETLMQSVRTRRLNDTKRQDGVLIENRTLDRHLRGLMPERTFQ